MTTLAKKIIDATRKLSDRMDALAFSDPVAFTYNPLVYARETHEEYLRRFAGTHKRVIFIGMNPGPFGMAQTGVPFGEIAAVQDWMGIFGFVGQPPKIHPAKPVDGFACKRSEVSGRRLWGLCKDRFGTPESFFEKHYVTNFCPLLFVAGNDRGKNLTPEDLVPAERDAVLAPCDDYLRTVTELLQPEWLVGVGAFAQKAAIRACSNLPVKFSTIIHPSPASPIANRGWAENVTAALKKNGIWE